MAATATFDQLPAPLTSTRQTVACTVTKDAGEARLLEIKVTSQSPSQPEEELDAEAFAPEPEPPVPQGTLLCHFDSTHWKNGETVTFRIYAKTPEDTDWVLEGTTTRAVVNGFVITVDTDPTPDGTYALFKEKLEAGNYGELPCLDSAGWTKSDSLGKLPPMQVHVVFCHGTPAAWCRPAGAARSARTTGRQATGTVLGRWPRDTCAYRPLGSNRLAHWPT